MSRSRSHQYTDLGAGWRFCRSSGEGFRRLEPVSGVVELSAIDNQAFGLAYWISNSGR